MVSQNNNPEVEVDVRKPNTVINQQIYQLQLITNRLTNAHQGLDVEWVDTEVLGSGMQDGSGSGSGDQDDGSGYMNRQSDDISFTQPTVKPPVVRTRYPPGSSNDNEPYDNGRASASTYSLPMLVPLLVITICVHWTC